MRQRRTHAIAAYGLVAIALLSACGSSSKTSSSAQTAAGAAQTVAAASAGGKIATVDGQTVPAVPDSQTDPAVPDTTRSLIVTASLKLQATDVGAAVNALTTIAIGQGGNVYNSQVQLDSPATASVELRVPPPALAQTETLIGKLGKVTGLTQQVQDVTAAAADLDARIKTAQASVDRVRGFLDKATSLTDLANIESQVTQRETTLEQLQAQQRTMSAQTALSTLTVDITGPEVTEKKDHLPSIVAGLKGGLRAFVAVVTIIGLALAATLPFALVAVVIGVPVWRMLRRSQRSRSGAQGVNAIADTSAPPTVASGAESPKVSAPS